MYIYMDVWTYTWRTEIGFQPAAPRLRCALKNVSDRASEECSVYELVVTVPVTVSSKLPHAMSLQTKENFEREMIEWE